MMQTSGLRVRNIFLSMFERDRKKCSARKTLVLLKLGGSSPLSVVYVFYRWGAGGGVLLTQENVLTISFLQTARAMCIVYQF